MREANYKSFMVERVVKRVKELHYRNVSGIDNFLVKLGQTIVELKDESDHAGFQKYLDILFEGRFAIILARNGFQEIEMIREDNRSRRPDIKAQFQECIVYFEVTRVNPQVDEW
jgi:hypothetical protein